jgi:aminoglycoside phosphotransferase (APT) family kinase protein
MSVARQRRHGFNDDATTRTLLRSPPSAAALRWASACVGEAVERWQVLRGGMSSAMYVLFTASGHEVVLRCYVRPDVNEEEPDLASREAAALVAVAAADVATPTLVAVDETGSEVGVPAVLMTRLPGRVVWDPTNVEVWVRSLANVLPAIHAVRGESGIGRYFNYAQKSYEPPAWATDVALWEAAIELYHGPVLESERCFIHRDYHPGNVLWYRRRLTGVVDWQAACIGPPSVDIGHCRANLLQYAPELADVFCAYAEQALGMAFHPWGDLGALIGMLDHLRESPPDRPCREAIERAIERAVTDVSRA